MAYYPPGTGIPPYYYPTNSSDEARAAYTAWSDHYARWPYANPVLQAPTGTWHYTQTAYYPSPIHQHYPVHPPGFQPYGWEPPKKEKKKKKKKDDSDSDSNSDDGWGNYQYTDAQSRPIKTKKRVKDDDGKPWIGHYVPAGEAPLIGEGVKSDGRFHYNWRGRTAEQVQADRHRDAIASGVYTVREKMPRAAPADQFWVTHKDGKSEQRLYRFDEIEAKMKGKWKVDERHGNSYFVKKGDKAPKGWESD